MTGATPRGEPFNPRCQSCGFHPEEIVARRHDLTDGQKWLSDRLVRWARPNDGARENERAGEVWRSPENMAEELGQAPRPLGPHPAKLLALHPRTHPRRDRRHSHTYSFLFHPSFISRT